MQRIIVIGCPGAGKSTFARALRDSTGLPLIYLDSIYHKPDRTTLTREEFDLRLREILWQKQWIIDGNYGRTLPERFEACDTVIFLDYPTELCLAGAAARVGQQREEIPWVEEALDPAFAQWIRDFSERADGRERICRLIEQYKACRDIHICTSREMAAQLLLTIQQTQKDLCDDKISRKY